LGGWQTLARATAQEIAMATQFLSAPLRSGFATLPSRDWVGWLVVLWRTLDTRRGLAGLDDHLLRDIGVSRLEARLESGRAPWDL